MQGQVLRELVGSGGLRAAGLLIDRAVSLPCCDAIKLAKIKKEATSLIKRYGKENIREPLAEEKQAILDKETPNFIAALAVKRELSRYAKRESIYRRAVKPYTSSAELLEDSKNYTHFDELEARYLELISERV